MKIDVSEQIQGSFGRTYVNNHNEEKGQQQKSKDSVVFAGDTVMSSRLIDERRQFGRDRALQVVKDTFKADKKIDDRIDSLRNQITDLRSQTKELTQNLKEVDAKQKQLLETYDVQPGSQEYEDLLLMNKERIYEKYGFKEEEYQDFFTEDEWNRLQVLKERGPSEYQRQSMENQEAREHYSKQLTEIRETIETNYRSVTAIKQARVKTHPMVDAKEAADEIIALSEQSIKGMLINEGLETIEAEKEANQEQIEEAQKKKEEEEGTNLEVINNTTEVKNQGLKSGLQEATLDVDQVQLSIGKIVDDMQLMMEDLKGLIVDKNL